MIARLNVDIDQPTPTRDVYWDCLFLSLIVQLSLILYVRGLGFYSDDWELFALFNFASDQSPFGLFRSVWDAQPHTHTRPLQMFSLAVLNWMFGLNPLGYHVVTGLLINATILLFYFALRQLGQSRLLSLSVPLVYALLPHYSTDRFWIIAAIPANMSMALYFLSLYADLRALRARSSRLWMWKLISVLSILGSILSYEVVLPLFLLNLLLVWYYARNLNRANAGEQVTQGKLFGLSTISFLALMSVTGFKALLTTRTEISGSYVAHIVRLIRGVVSVFYGWGGYGLGLPQTVGRILRHFPNGTITTLSVVAGLIVFAYLYYSVSRAKSESLPGRGVWLKLFALGVVVLGLGYAIFLTNAQVGFSKTGIVNRTAIAATAGIAMQLVGAFGWASTLLAAESQRRAAFCALVALLCMSGFLIINTLGSFWVEADRQQHEILADIRQHVPTLPGGSTLFLDGICTNVGPGIVFESHWDLSGALKLAYDDPSLEANVVTPRLKIGEENLSTYIYNHYHLRRYPYNNNLLLYSLDQKKIYQLIDAEIARRYFESFNQNLSSQCRGYEGAGAYVF